MARRHVAPARLRIRLTIAFVLVAGISSGALAVGSYVLVRQARLSDSLERASADTARDLRAAQGFHSGEEQNLLQGIESTTVHAIFVQPGSEPQPSNASFDPRIPAALRALVSQGNLAYQRIAFRPPGRPAAHFLLVGGPGPPAIRGSQLYLLFSEDRIFRDLDQLRDVLAIGWVVVLLLATAVGRTLARRTLAPIGRASEAARAMAAGELDTRLPAEGRDEFAAWATSFNAMADALETKINQLSDAQAREAAFHLRCLTRASDPRGGACWRGVAAKGTPGPDAVGCGPGGAARHQRRLATPSAGGRADGDLPARRRTG